MLSGIVIQARTGSTRLPNKMLLPFYKDKSVFEIVVERLKTGYSNYPIFLATTTNKADDALVVLAKKLKINVFRGDENDVLSRFTEIAQAYNLKYIVRVCADNPFLDVEHIQTLINKIEKENEDYVSFDFGDGTPTILSHLGLYTEIAKTKTLIELKDKTSEPFYFEHVTNYIYKNPKEYTIKLLPLPLAIRNNKSIRLTLDTREDFDLQKHIFRKIYGAKSNITINELIENINQNPSYLIAMKAQIILNKK